MIIGSRRAMEGHEHLTGTGGIHMIGYAITFFIVALIAGALGFWGLAGLAAEIAKFLCVVFVILLIISMVRGRGPRL